MYSTSLFLKPAQICLKLSKFFSLSPEKYKYIKE